MNFVFDIVIPLIFFNVKSIDTNYLIYGTDYFYVAANAARELLR